MCQQWECFWKLILVCGKLYINRVLLIVLLVDVRTQYMLHSTLIEIDWFNDQADNHPILAHCHLSPKDQTSPWQGPCLRYSSRINHQMVVCGINVRTEYMFFGSASQHPNCNRLIYWFICQSSVTNCKRQCKGHLTELSLTWEGANNGKRIHSQASYQYPSLWFSSRINHKMALIWTRLIRCQQLEWFCKFN